MSYDAVSRPIARHPRYPLPDERLAAALAEVERLRAALRKIGMCARCRRCEQAARAALAATDGEAGP